MDMQTTNALIEAVKLHPSLYGRHQQSSGGNIDQKNLIWKEISLKIDQPIDKCKAKVILYLILIYSFYGF